MMPPKRILLLEDNADDAELVTELLNAERERYEVTRVETRDAFVDALGRGGIDLVLADYKLPAFDGLSALRLVQQERPDLPFIFVSGTLGEELAIEALKVGATDYVLKTRLSRLLPSVRRAAREAQERAERRNAEEALRRSEMYLTEAQRLSHTGSFGWNVSSGEIYWSDETYRIFECEPTATPTVELVLGRTHPDDREGLRQIIERASVDRAEFIAEHRLVMADGSVKHLRAVAHPVTAGDAKAAVFAGAVTDITEQRRAEVILREQADMLRMTHDAILVHNMDGAIGYWNRGAEALYGWTAEEATGAIATDLLKPIFPTPLERIAADLLSTGHWEGEVVRTRKDGAQVTVASRRSLQRNAQGQPIGVLETNNDISERKRLRQLEADLARMDRVSTMGELAASLAHEIKQPIAAAVMNANACRQFLRHDAPDLAEASNAALAMVTAAMSAADIVDRVRSLYGRGTPEWRAVDVNDIVREMTVLLGDATSRNSISVRTELDPALPLARADRVQLQQVLMNLMLNAIDAMKEMRGELTIRSRKTEEGQLLIAVCDCGIGLPTENAERIFEAFFSTKPQGTGMGLSISRQIIEAHGGRLWASPNKAKGATLQFTLPGEATESIPSPARGEGSRI